MLLELTDLERELERLFGSNMPGHGGAEEPEPEPEDEEPDEEDPA
jgi:hypothetical protein